MSGSQSIGLRIFTDLPRVASAVVERIRGIDGVVVVPRTDAERVLERVKLLLESEEWRIRDIDAGTLFRPEIDETLRRKGVSE